MNQLATYQTLIAIVIAQAIAVALYFIRMHVRMTTLETKECDNREWHTSHEKKIDERFRDHDLWQQRQDSVIADLSKVLTRVDERTQMIYDEVRRTK